MTIDNVVDLAAHRPQFLPPGHFKKIQRACWDELVRGTAPALHVPANFFTFEFAATLLARFRSGRAMTATEQKELRHYLAVLGLRKEEPEPEKTRNSRKYFDP